MAVLASGLTIAAPDVAFAAAAGTDMSCTAGNLTNYNTYTPSFKSAFQMIEGSRVRTH